MSRGGGRTRGKCGEGCHWIGVAKTACVSCVHDRRQAMLEGVEKVVFLDARNYTFKKENTMMKRRAHNKKRW